jgi:hypothetical protein
MSSTSRSRRSNSRTHGFGWAGVVRVGAGGIDVLIACRIFGRFWVMRQAVRALHPIFAWAFYAA